MGTNVFHGFLMRTILRRYAFSGPSLPTPGPKWAEIAWNSKSTPELLVNACDAWGISVGELARRSGVEQAVLSSYVMGVARIEEVSTGSVMFALHEMIGEKTRG